MLNIINKVAPYTDRSMPGGWSDLDMLEVGLGGMTDEEVCSQSLSNVREASADALIVQSALLDVGRVEVAALAR